MEPEFPHDGLVVPLARADDELDRLAGQPGLDGDRLTGLALQAAEQPVDDQGGVLPLLGAVEPRQIPLQEGGQAVGAVADRVGCDGGVAQQGLSLGVSQQRHRWTSVRVAYPPPAPGYAGGPTGSRNRLQ